MNISEIFYSIQGEGPTIGKPSIFIRLGMCNLHCGGIKKDNTKWHCDTFETWNQYEDMEIQDIIRKVLILVPRLSDPPRPDFDARGISAVITGGEPMLQSFEVNELIQRLKGYGFYIELETNGTIMPPEEIYNQVDHFNVSPKLPNSGNKLPAPHSPKAIELYAQAKGYFKFVVTDREDVKHIMEYYGGYLERAIQEGRVYLMPACESVKEFQNVAPTVAEICKDLRFNFSSRLQVNIWDKTTGV